MQEPFYRPGETFKCGDFTLKSVECQTYECTGCFFHENKDYGCLDYFDIHGCCAASDIGRHKSIKFVKVENPEEINSN